MFKLLTLFKKHFVFTLIFSQLLLPTPAQAGIFFLIQKEKTPAIVCFIGSATLWALAAPFSAVFLLGLDQKTESELQQLSSRLIQKFNYLDWETAQELAELILDEAQKAETLKSDPTRPGLFQLLLQYSDINEILDHSRLKISDQQKKELINTLLENSSL